MPAGSTPAAGSASFFSLLPIRIPADYSPPNWWLFFLRSLLIDPRIDDSLEPVSDPATTFLRSLYLRGSPRYRNAERESNRRFFDRHVRLVYGGGARNNAELFLPSCRAEGACTWDRRPSYEEILSFRGGALVEALEENPGVGLYFIRRNNEAFREDQPVPDRLVVEVRERAGNRGLITVMRDGPSGELVFHYRTDPASTSDPLDYGKWGRGEGSFGTYREWNDRTVVAGKRYVNAVAGIGAYLYSNRSAIGDVLVMHATDWNFGGNRGGLHRGEKTTILLVSGEGVEPGALGAPGRFRTDAEGAIVPDEGRTSHVPTLLDVAPTALAWLGHSQEAFERFAREEFPDFLDVWIRSQRRDILAHLDGMDTMERARAEAGLDELTLDALRPRISRLLAFVEAERERTLGRLEPGPMEGYQLALR